MVSLILLYLQVNGNEPEVDEEIENNNGEDNYDEDNYEDDFEVICNKITACAMVDCHRN